MPYLSHKPAFAVFPVYRFIVLPLFLVFVCQLVLPVSGRGASSNATIAENAPMELNLYEAILLALRTNRTITSAYMGRVRLHDSTMQIKKPNLSPILA